VVFLRKTKWSVSERAARVAARTWWAVVAATLFFGDRRDLTSEPQVKENFTTWPWGGVFTFLAVA
jgi:cytochrome bd-type quinol oxidase subunit 2